MFIYTYGQKCKSTQGQMYICRLIYIYIYIPLIFGSLAYCTLTRPFCLPLQASGIRPGWIFNTLLGRFGSVHLNWLVVHKFSVGLRLGHYKSFMSSACFLHSKISFDVSLPCWKTQLCRSLNCCNLKNLEVVLFIRSTLCNVQVPLITK